MKKIILILCVLLFAFTAKAQVINVCGTDSITLTVDNYVNGTIEWQESIDTITWATISEVSGMTYRFLPTQTKYYRAVVKTSDCQPLYSAISLVQLIPIANAGADRTIGNTSMTLLGNAVPGATGEWTILSGNGGVLDNTSNPIALFTGLDKEKYSLKWTLTNACGQSTDTVNITFDKLYARTNYIVIDKTDTIFSDSTEIANGTLRIKFSDPSIAPYDSVMLIGMRVDINFLLRVNAFTTQNSIYTFSVKQGELDDLFSSGTLNLGDAVNQALKTGASYQKVNSLMSSNSNSFPTRETLKSLDNNSDVKLLYSKALNGENLPSKSLAPGSKNEECLISFPDMLLFSSPDGLSFSIKDSYVRIDPKFVVDRRVDIFPPFLHYLRFGVDNGEFEFNIKTVLESSLSVNYTPLRKNILHYPTQLVITVGVLPIPLLVSIDIFAEFKIGATAAISLEQTDNYKVNVTALLEKTEESSISFKKNIQEVSTNDTKLSLQGSLGAEFKIGPEISFRVFNFFGPYLNIPAKLNFNVCSSINTNPENNNWQANASIGIDGTVGVNGKMGGWTLLDFSKPLFNDAFKKTLIMPNQLELISGNNQKGTSGNELSKPILLQVVSSSGFGIPFVPVRFTLEAGNGSVGQNVQYTDALGNVSVNWSLGSNPQNKLKVSVLDCNDNDIENSPMYVYASTASQTYDCTNSSLSVDMKTVNGYMSPSVTGGTAPYTYSTNGTDYSSTKPQFNILIPIKQTLFVKDKNLCIRSKTFEIKVVDACASSTLSMDVLVQPDILSITGKGGKTPYLFAVDNTASFTTTSTYYKLSTGKHTVYIKDSNGCMVSHDVVIDNVTTAAAIRSSYPAQNASSVPINGITFQWVAANYASNQVYDLYLKKGTDAYSLIASGLSSTSYTYTTALVASTTYTWKVAVKTGSTAIDYSEFTFITASGVTKAPAVPVLLQPQNGYITSGLAITLKWTPQAGDFKYDVYLDTKDASTLVAMNLTKSEFPINNFIDGKMYYWKVKIKSIINGSSSLSEIRIFTAYKNNVFNPNLTYGTMTDIDGNVYKTIKIGTQTWMAENLRTTRYRTGESIGTTTPATKNIYSENMPKYQWASYGDENLAAKYGRLYTGWAVADSRNIAPAGWHVSTDAEWTTLENYLIANGYNYDGTTTGNKIAKSLASTTDWYSNYSSPGTGSICSDLTKNNASGFTALPGGYRDYGGSIGFVKGWAFWWSSTEHFDVNGFWGRKLQTEVYYLYRTSDYKSMGYSVRCVRDY